MLKKKDLNLRKKLSIFFNKIINIHRSITGRGVLKTLNLISKELSCKIKVKTFKSGKKVFDWKVPLQWEIKDSYIITPENKKIFEFKKNNLHIMAYSMPYKNKMTLAKLKKKLFSLPEQPNAIPYVTSYYKKDWGFCISHDDKKN